MAEVALTAVPGRPFGYVAHSLDNATTFSFLGLPTELRLLVYSELLERQDPDSQKRLFPCILATSKEIYREARPELYTKTNLRLTVKATALKSRDFVTHTSLHVGQRTEPLLAAQDTGAVTSAWNLYSILPPAFGKISNVTIQILLSAQRHKGLLKHKLVAEQFNQVHQMLAALTAMWKVSSALRTLKVEFVDDTGTLQGPPSPHNQMMFVPAGGLERSELKRIFHPLRRLEAGVIISGSSLPSAVMESVVKRGEPPASHPFETCASLSDRVDAMVAKIRGGGLCCTQIGSVDEKPCAVRSLEKKMVILRAGIVSCRIRSQLNEEALEMDLDAVSEFLVSRKVLALVKLAAKEEDLVKVAAKEMEPMKMVAGEEEVLCLAASLDKFECVPTCARDG